MRFGPARHGALSMTSRLWTCTISAVPNKGVARLRIGIETKAAMKRPAVNRLA